jgi:hypothetical protein
MNEECESSAPAVAASCCLVVAEPSPLDKQQQQQPGQQLERQFASRCEFQSSPDASDDELNENELLDGDERFESVEEAVYTFLLDDAVFDVCLQMHRAARLGYLHLLCPERNEHLDKQYEIYSDEDVLGWLTSNY